MYWGYRDIGGTDIDYEGGGFAGGEAGRGGRQSSYFVDKG